MELINLAVNRFGSEPDDLNAAERYALAQIAVGEFADFDDFDPREENEAFDPHRLTPAVPLMPGFYGPEPNPAGPPPDKAADESDAKRTIRADRLIWLLTDP